MSDVSTSDLTSEEEAAAAEDRVWSDFEFEVVTDPKAERLRVLEFEEQLIRDAALADDEEQP